MLIEGILNGSGATALWVYAPGYLDDHCAKVENMQALTGIRLGVQEARGAINVRITHFEHPLTRDLPAGYAYGTGIDLEQYLRPPRAQYLPEMELGPVFFADDPEAQVLGLVEYEGQQGWEAGLVVKHNEGWRSIYSAAPLLPWQLMRNIARFAGVHIYNEAGDMLWANNAFLALYSQSNGKHKIRFPRPVDVEDAYSGEKIGTGLESLELEMQRWETRLMRISDTPAT